MYEKETNVIFSNGIFTNLCQKFIQYKRGMGQKFPRGNQYDLLNTCRLLNEMDLCAPILTRETVETVAASRSGESPATQAKRICFLRHLRHSCQPWGLRRMFIPKTICLNTNMTSDHIFLVMSR